MGTEAERYGAAPGRAALDGRRLDGEARARHARAARSRLVRVRLPRPRHRRVAPQLPGCRSGARSRLAPRREHATAAGVDALVVQGAEAGGHQGSFSRPRTTSRARCSLLLEEIAARNRRCRSSQRAAIATAADIAGALAAGARRRPDRLGVPPGRPRPAPPTPHRQALRGDGTTQAHPCVHRAPRTWHRQPLHARARRLRAAGVPLQIHSADRSDTCGRPHAR